MDFAERTNLMIELMDDGTKPSRALKQVGLQDAHVEIDPELEMDDATNKTLLISYQGEAVTLRAESLRGGMRRWHKDLPGWQHPHDTADWKDRFS